ncbi:MAG: DUF5652 family protein [Vicingaceae bacterium]|nr:DUF5652 family protein [Vicingaceae bacterium]
MENLELLTNPIILTLIVIVAIWDGIWKLIGLWKSARNNDLVWFVCIAIFNTVGILPIIYILSKKKEEAANE